MAFEGFLTSVYADDDISRPTFFELVAKDQLLDALRPAVQFVVGVFADQAPPRTLRVLAHWETIYHVLLTTLEWYHLTVHGASFAEHFYGLQRQKHVPSHSLNILERVELERQRRKSPKLSLKHRILSLIIVVLLPWVKLKCDTYFRHAESLVSSARSSQQKCALVLYPWIHACSHATKLGYSLLYLLGRTDVWSPSLHVLGLRMTRHFPEHPSLAQQPQTKLARLWEVVSSAGTASLWGSVYLLQFAQWWYQREHLLQPYQQRKVPPPPPEKPPYQAILHSVRTKSNDLGDGKRMRLVLLPQDPTICALCHRTRRNPAMSSSGYVFCYPCLVLHVRECGHCPVTGQDMGVEQIRRIRDSSDDSQS